MGKDYKIDDDINSIDKKVASLSTNDDPSAIIAMAELLKAKAALVTASVSSFGVNMLETLQKDMHKDLGITESTDEKDSG